MVPQPPSDDAVGHLRRAFDGDREEDLPRSVTGKVQKRRVREALG